MSFICRLQNQVDDVVDVMKSNVGKVLERGEKLEDLQDKSGWLIVLICLFIYSFLNSESQSKTFLFILSVDQQLK